MIMRHFADLHAVLKVAKKKNNYIYTVIPFRMFQIFEIRIPKEECPVVVEICGPVI